MSSRKRKRAAPPAPPPSSPPETPVPAELEETQPLDPFSEPPGEEPMPEETAGFAPGARITIPVTLASVHVDASGTVYHVQADGAHCPKVTFTTGTLELEEPPESDVTVQATGRAVVLFVSSSPTAFVVENPHTGEKLQLAPALEELAVPVVGAL